MNHGNQKCIKFFFYILGEPIKGTILEFLWGEGLPDDENFSEHCVVMTREGLFDDRHCNDTYPFVCKIAVENISFNKKCNCFDQGRSNDFK